MNKFSGSVSTLCSIFAVGLCLASSNPPAPTPFKSAGEPKTQTANNKDEAGKDKRATLQQPAIVEVLKTPVIQVETTDKTEKHRDYTDGEWWLVYATVALAFITLGLAIYTAKLYASTKKIASDAESAATNSINLTRTIERAYVQMSHFSNEHVHGLSVNPITGYCTVTINIKNYGATPAKITRIFLTKRALIALPTIPDYTIDIGDLAEQPIQAFLMKDSDVNVGFQFWMNVSDLPLIREREKQLVVYGFVDYTDQFGRNFRGKYARNYVPGLIPNNLIFVPQPGYNDDEERKET